MVTHNSDGTVLVKHNESGAIAQALLLGRTPNALNVNLKGVPLTFERVEDNKYIATCSSLSFELVSG